MRPQDTFCFTGKTVDWVFSQLRFFQRVGGVDSGRPGTKRVESKNPHPCKKPQGWGTRARRWWVRSRENAFTGLGRPGMLWFTGYVRISQQITDSGAGKSRARTISEEVTNRVHLISQPDCRIA